MSPKKQKNDYYFELTQYLLENGADINAQSDISHYSALIFATVKNHVDCVEILLQHGANQTLRSLTGRSALNYALEKKFSGCIILLLEGKN